MTEIPEHLLQRSRERRAAMGRGDAGGEDAAASSAGSEGSEAGSSAAPAPAASTPAAMPAHPAPAEPPAVPPPSPMVQAHQRRRKIPFWAVPVLAALPVWAYVYAGTLSPPPAGEGPLTLGAEAYEAQGCGGCHGPSGGGTSVAPAFTGGSIYETFPSFEQHFQWVRLGSAGWQEEVGATYGAPDKPVEGGMPGFGEDAVSDADLLYLIMHERQTLGGEPPNEAEAARLEMAAQIFFENPEMTFEDVMAEVDAELPPGESEGGAIEGQGDPELEPEASEPVEDDPELG